MTKIIYGNYGGRYYFEASGHAIAQDVIDTCGCDEEESGAVCAAVSILVQAVCARLSEMESNGELIHLGSELQSGYACFDVTPRESSDGAVNEIFELLMAGLSLLEENYPDLVCCD